MDKFLPNISLGRRGDVGIYAVRLLATWADIISIVCDTSLKAIFDSLTRTLRYWAVFNLLGHLRRIKQVKLETCDHLLLRQCHQALPTVGILQGLASCPQPHSLSRKGSHNSPPTNTFYYCCLKWSAICHPSVWFNKLYALRINLQVCQGSKYFELICSFIFRAVNLPSDAPFG